MLLLYIIGILYSLNQVIDHQVNAQLGVRIQYARDIGVWRRKGETSWRNFEGRRLYACILGLPVAAFRDVEPSDLLLCFVFVWQIVSAKYNREILSSFLLDKCVLLKYREIMFFTFYSTNSIILYFFDTHPPTPAVWLSDKMVWIKLCVWW